MARRDPSLDTLLDLDGQVLVIDEAGYWVKFVVNQVPATADKPHGLDYTLTMHGPDGARLVGFDNAHQVEGQRGGAPQAKTTSTDCARSNPMTTRTPALCWRRSGKKLNR